MFPGGLPRCSPNVDNAYSHITNSPAENEIPAIKRSLMVFIICTRTLRIDDLVQFGVHPRHRPHMASAGREFHCRLHWLREAVDKFQHH
jgi:hypothetical protein